MKNPLDSLWGTIISGLVITVILYFIAHAIVSGAKAGA
jgi:amino acid transporter